MPRNVTLPIFDREVYDNSVVETHARCPRKFFYTYRLCRAPAGKNWPIEFGLAYHKYRELLENLYIKDPDEAQWPVYHEAVKRLVCESYENPPLDHKREWQNVGRLDETLDKSFVRWQAEKRAGQFRVLGTETAFDLTLPSGRRFGGRLDQIVEWNNDLWFRDFKTTARMGSTYADQFDPNNQFTGYTWGSTQLSGREVEGAIVETVYNTKTKGPEIHQHLSNRSAGQVEHWVEEMEDEIASIERHIEADVWPKRTTACGDYGGCFFRECCQQEHWHAIETWLKSKTIESHWDFMNPEGEKGVAQD
jgi:hypothetical protein